MDRELDDYKDVIPNYMLEQLEKSLSQDFIGQFPILEKINY